MNDEHELTEDLLEGRGEVVTATLDGIDKYGPRDFMRQVMQVVGGRLTEKQGVELAALLEDAAFWVEHDQKEDHAKNYFFFLSAGNLAKAEESGDEADLEQAWRLYSRFNPYTGNKEGPGA